ncbi:MAG: bacillithiol biosynthesis cysteine-adding enzyme BshC [Saprospiraceae bacterium]|nr:bacillithiol biosynthesis cysteine-adding enzyme BshC [Saprospiraceae bacterium]
MKTEFFPFSVTNQFADTDVAYAEQDERLRSYYKYTPRLSSFQEVIEDKSKDPIDRDLLQSVLSEQYDVITSDTSQAAKQIEKLGKASTFTITTAHQPCLFTGPVFFIYKVMSAIKLARLLKSEYASYDFVPVLVLGGEDHDFDEMNHANIFNKRIEWQNNETGSVGRMSTDSVKGALKDLQDILGNSPFAQTIHSDLEKCLSAHVRYDVAMADWINHLLGSYGVIILRMDHMDLKRKAISLFTEELTNQPSAALVQDAQSELEQAGIKAQAYVREINLFYLTETKRERIVLEEGEYAVLNSDIRFTSNELMEHLSSHPDRFSPNVVLRPLYQEIILPNLAYIGGGGELAYWLERKTQFEHFGINFPMLVRRDSLLWLDKGTQKKMLKLNLTIDQFFLRKDRIISQFLKSHAAHEFQLKDEKGKIVDLFAEIATKAGNVDPTLVSTVEAEAKNQIKSLEHLEAKLKKAEKQRHEIEIKQIENIVDKLMPDGRPQERHENFLSFFTRLEYRFFDAVLAAADPLDMQLKVIHES